MADNEVNASDAELSYYKYDGCLFRQNSPEEMPEIYRGQGQWEPWYDLYPVLHGSQVDADAASQFMAWEDSRPSA